MLFQTSLLILAPLLALVPSPTQDSRRKPSEPAYYTAFGRKYLTRENLVVLATVSATERMGPSSRILVTLSQPEWIQGSVKMSPLQAIGSVNGAFRKGQRLLLFVRQTPKTLQLWVEGSVPGTEPNFEDKLTQVKTYLKISQLPDGKRFDATREFLERVLRTGKPWARTNALRELAEIVLDHPTRFEPSRFQLWRRSLKGSADLVSTVRKIEIEWRKLEKKR